MKSTADKRKKAGNSAISAIMDAIRAVPLRLPQTQKVFREIANDLAKHEARFGEQMKKVEKELASGCRRTKGDIV